MSKTVMFVNHKPSRCGVYQFGKTTGLILTTSNLYHFNYIECADKAEFDMYYDKLNPVACIFNRHPITMPWVDASLTQNLKSKILLIMHDSRDVLPNSAIIHPDPTFIEQGIDFKVGRALMQFTDDVPLIANSIGTFGFSFRHKGLVEMIHKVNAEFDAAIVRMHLPLNSFVDSSKIAELCKNLTLCKRLVKDSIKLDITHAYFNDQQLLEWLAGNSINIFSYDSHHVSEGVSSTIDWALSVRRPIGVSMSRMFRHINHDKSLCLERNTLKSIIGQGTKPLEHYYANWTQENLLKDYEKVLNTYLQ